MQIKKIRKELFKQSVAASIIQGKARQRKIQQTLQIQCRAATTIQRCAITFLARQRQWYRTLAASIIQRYLRQRVFKTEPEQLCVTKERLALMVHGATVI